MEMKNNDIHDPHFYSKKRVFGHYDKSYFVVKKSFLAPC
jgi:hypothetical protein